MINHSITQLIRTILKPNTLHLKTKSHYKNKIDHALILGLASLKRKKKSYNKTLKTTHPTKSITNLGLIISPLSFTPSNKNLHASGFRNKKCLKRSSKLKNLHIFVWVYDVDDSSFKKSFKPPNTCTQSCLRYIYIYIWSISCAMLVRGSYWSTDKITNLRMQYHSKFNPWIDHSTKAPHKHRRRRVCCYGQICNIHGYIDTQDQKLSQSHWISKAASRIDREKGQIVISKSERAPQKHVMADSSRLHTLPRFILWIWFWKQESITKLP